MIATAPTILTEKQKDTRTTLSTNIPLPTPQAVLSSLNTQKHDIFCNQKR